MRLTWVAVLLAAAASAASPSDLTGTWKVVFAGPKDSGPKTVGSIILDLKVEGAAISGTARIGVWPGEAPIADGRLDGNQITFNATGHLGSTTGVPTCHFTATVTGDQMVLTMTAIENTGGPLGRGVVYEYRGKKQESTAPAAR